MSSRIAQIEVVPSFKDQRIAHHFAAPLQDAGLWQQGRPNSIREAQQLLSAAEKVIAAQQERIAQLENLALTDELTGLLNRRGLMLALKRELAAAARDPEAQGMLVMVDLDGFKSINDTQGHNAGDAYLQTVATALQTEVRPSDVVARLGGDEFAVLLKRIDEPKALARLARMEHSFHTHSLTWQGKVLPLRASFGAALYDGMVQPEAVLASADLRLYAQKARRR